MTKLAPEWVRNCDPVIRSPARYRWTTAPAKQRHRTIPPGIYEELKAHLRNLLDTNVIRQSHSPWCSNVVMARKKDNSLRLCIDYRQLNQKTIKDSYALPRIEETLDCLAGSKFVSVLDMKSGYHQIEMEENHKQYTAFSVGSLGLFEYNRMPFGLTNSPATYQRLMKECFESLNHKECVIFLDDIVVVMGIGAKRSSEPCRTMTSHETARPRSLNSPVS